jgi:N-acetylglucosaminyldiphosphoundecaprenol N-acetyl-beta-D-mannosaminyltransferase
MGKPFLGLSLPLISSEEFYDLLQFPLKKSVRIATVNAEFYLLALKNPDFAKLISSMDYCTIDGAGPHLALKIYQKHLGLASPEKYSGADMIVDLFERHGDLSYYLLGGTDQEMTTVVATLGQLYPSLRIVGAEGGGEIQTNGSCSSEMIERINRAKPDVVLVGFGAPKQEAWIHRYANHVGPSLLVGVGGALKFFGVKRRAPRFIRQLHLEWLARAVLEPGHWRRSLRVLVQFPAISLTWIIRHW